MRTCSDVHVGHWVSSNWIDDISIGYEIERCPSVTGTVTHVPYRFIWVEDIDGIDMPIGFQADD